jgi:phosphopantothenoylcysteine decarboxylase / phosphopantothenate---cysteine ligase
MLKGKKIILGITASIAAYKSILLLRSLEKAGAEVRVVMTPASCSFVSPLVMSTFSKHNVWTAFEEGNQWHNHVELGLWGDVFIIAPASCNTLAKMAHGLCDNILLATYLSARCPVVIVPAMDEDMYRHPTTTENLKRLRSFGNHVLSVGHGPLASGLTGEGRMAEPEDIIRYLGEKIFRGNALQGIKVLITAGPTREAIDPVRYISNHSSGKMGIALAEACHLQGAEVCLIAGPMAIKPQFEGIRVISVVSAGEMNDACLNEFPHSDWCIMAAAVADYRPAHTSPEKLSKKNGDLHFEWERTPDILANLGNRKKEGQLLVGFALETENEEANALEKLARKKLDLIVMNSMKTPGAGFNSDTNEVIVFSRSGDRQKIDMNTKRQVAENLIHIFMNSALS